MVRRKTCPHTLPQPPLEAASTLTHCRPPWASLPPPSLRHHWCEPLFIASGLAAKHAHAPNLEQVEHCSAARCAPDRLSESLRSECMQLQALRSCS